MNRFYYSSSILEFTKKGENEILGILTKSNEFPLQPMQRFAWSSDIDILKKALLDLDGKIIFEFSVPRMGKRIDVVLVIRGVIFVLEFKVGEKEFLSSSIDQVWDYALDLKYFHSKSQDSLISPILIATEASYPFGAMVTSKRDDKVLDPLKTNSRDLRKALDLILKYAVGEPEVSENWEVGKYTPTPTIIEAATALYNDHSVTEITKNDASAKNLSITTGEISNIIGVAKEKGEKVICFVTGVPGSGKTLVGLT